VDIRNLRQVLAVKQHGSFAKAAAALGIAQPSLSKSIARFEDELKAPIFVRGASGSELTPLGKVIAEHALRVIDETRSLEQAAELVIGGESGMIRLGIGPALKHTFAPRLIERIADLHPKLDLLIDVADGFSLLPALAERKLDVVLCVRDQAINDSGFVITHVLSSFGVAMASAHHPLAAEARVSAARYAEFAASGPRNIELTVDAIFGRTDEDRGGARYIINDFEPILPLVRAAKATMWIPAFAAAHLARSGVVQQLNVDVDLELSFVAVATPAVAASPILQKIVGYACEIGADLEESQAFMRPVR
jgi:DNA-binding transcriptional LysR family regulator